MLLQVWLSTRGGEVLLASEPGVTEKFEEVKLNSRGFGILDVGCVPLGTQSSCVRVRRAENPWVRMRQS